MTLSTPTLISPADNYRSMGFGNTLISAEPKGSSLASGTQLGLVVGLSTSPLTGAGAPASAGNPGINNFSTTFGASGDAIDIYAQDYSLPPGTLVYYKVWTWDQTHGGYSPNGAVGHYFTSANPTVVQTAPIGGAIFDSLEAVELDWLFGDIDPNQAQHGASVFLSPGLAGSGITQVDVTGTTSSTVLDIGVLRPNQQYNWWVTVYDSTTAVDGGTLTASQRGSRSATSAIRTFLVTGSSTPPLPNGPSGDEAVEVDAPFPFDWLFRDPDPGDFQTRADLRYRVVGQSDADWQTVFGTTTTPGTANTWTLPVGTFEAGFNYEYQIRTYDNLSAPGTSSDWSVSAFFWGIATIGGSSGPVIPSPQVAMGALGQGTYRVFVYERGGQRRVGEITNIQQGQWARLRDDISPATLTTLDLGWDKGLFYGSLRAYHHEIAIFRDKGNGEEPQRVWEGPITRIGFYNDHIDMDCADVMQYVYRRIMKQGYNDAYPNLQSVVYRASRIIANALGPDDPNVLTFLTRFIFADDTRESRIKQDYSSTAWEEVDDLAANAGLDYTTVGRRIVLFDTHRPIGRLPVMTDGDFSDPPVVTEYGNNLATEYAVTNGTGVYGSFLNATDDPFYGRVELLSSSYSETTSADADVLTPASLAALQATLVDQAQRGAAGRYPGPIEVRVPDNSSLNPEIGVDINYLVPGVWIPLQSTGTPRDVTQWQKLDSVTVAFDSSGESVQVVMSPAPGNGADPDADLDDGDEDV